jgi:hypothetical protein
VGVCTVLVTGGLVARAADSPSAAPANQQITWSGANTPAVAPPPPTSSTITTTIAAPAPSASGGQTSGALDQSVGVSVGGATGPSESTGGVSESIGVAVLPGPMTVAPTGEMPVFRRLGSFDGSQPAFAGDLSPITVTDARGSLAGWHAGISLESVSGLTAGQLAHARLCASPDRPTMVAGNPVDVVRGDRRTCAGLGQTVPVFFAASGGGGGTYSDSAGLVLSIPGIGPDSGGVTATLAVSVH